ncbi:hypothetical protein UFOVP1230_46 [uncultured Caudovirales phage]|uniref:Uncharacterized protein n=1 Tax=uncultured Caudovirales phage TaxID=2100421 RepID=A0A6J5R3L2_9CAUD|nr:hypothetical protein UFOVP1230_46 [uncultured Caudovirales phage]
MKKFVFPVANGGAPFTNDSIVGILQEEQSAALEAIVAGLTAHWNGTQQAVILSGCEVTSLGASLYSINNGFVWINGKITRATGTGSTTLPAYIIENTPTDLLSTDVTNATFEDASNPILATETTTFIDTAPPGSGEYITIDPYAFGIPSRLEFITSHGTNKFVTEVTKSGSTSPTTLTISTTQLRLAGLIRDSFPATTTPEVSYPNIKAHFTDLIIQVYGYNNDIDAWVPISLVATDSGITSTNSFLYSFGITGNIGISIKTDSIFNGSVFRIVVIG